MKFSLSLLLKVFLASLFLSTSINILSGLDFQKEVSFSNTTTGTSVIKAKIKILYDKNISTVALDYYWEPAKGYEGLKLPSDNVILVEFVIDSTRYYLADNGGGNLEAFKWSNTNSNIRENDKVFFKNIGTGLNFSGYLSEDNNKNIYNQLERGNYIISRSFFVTNQDSLYTQKIKRNKKIEEEKRIVEEKGRDEQLRLEQEDLEREERLIKEKLIKEKKEKEENILTKNEQEIKNEVSLNNTDKESKNDKINNPVSIETDKPETNTVKKTTSVRKYNGNQNLTLKYELTEEMIRLYSERFSEMDKKKAEEAIKKKDYIEKVKSEAMENKYKL